MTTIIKAGSYCPVCRGMPLSDCHHSMAQFRSAVTGYDASKAVEAERERCLAALDQYRSYEGEDDPFDLVARVIRNAVHPKSAGNDQ